MQIGARSMTYTAPASRVVAPMAPVAPARPVTLAHAPQAQAGGRTGFWDLFKATIVNGFGPLSGLLSIGNDMKELRSDSANKTAHVVEVLGDVVNIASWPLALIPGVGKGIAAAASLLGMVVKTTGEMMAGR